MTAPSLRPTHARFTPRCEQLEDRLTPAVTVDLSQLAAGTLTLNGNKARDRIQIIDQGTDAAGAITVIANGTTIFTATGEKITQIRVLDGFGKAAGGIDDIVGYQLPMGMSVDRTVIASLGSGNDRFTVDAPFGTGTNGKFSASCFGGTGNDVLQANVGALQLFGPFGVGFSGDQGNDKLSVSVVNGTVVEAKAQLEALMLGGAGDDDLRFEFAGILREAPPPPELEQAGLRLHVGGGEGRDTINVAITLDVPGGKLSEVIPAIFGTEAAQVTGNGGNDRVRFVVNGTPGAGSATLLDGGPGRDRCRAEGAVGMTLNCES